uniref:peptidylprolyl isomerase n=1 Tax=Florenciella parvula TaxID=236787 RepID=A0A7S2G8N1_9STRA
MGTKRPYSIASLDCFDELMDTGITVEKEPQQHILGDALVAGQAVTIHCVAMTWNGSELASEEFSSTYEEGESPMRFVLDGTTVTAGLQKGLINLRVGEKATITCSPAMAYGDAGMPPLVKPHSFVIYKVEVISANATSGDVELAGPNDLVRPRSVRSRTGAGFTSVRHATSPLVILPDHTEAGAAAGGADAAGVPPGGIEVGADEENMLAQAADDLQISRGGRPPKPPSPPLSSTLPSSTSGFPIMGTPPTPAEPRGAFYSLEQLKNPPFPEGVDASMREVYLDDMTFEEVMGMGRPAFSALPGWKKANLKKAAGLF